jgi:hypothetical protein
MGLFDAGEFEQNRQVSAARKDLRERPSLLKTAVLLGDIPHTNGYIQ